MAPRTYKPDWQRAVIALSAAVIGFLIVTVLYTARVIFIPLALAIYLTFVLAPLVKFLQRRGLPRPAATIAVVGLTLFAVGTVGWVIGHQLSGLTAEVAKKENADRIRQKIDRVKGWVSGPDESGLSKLAAQIEEAFAPPHPADDKQEVVVTPRGNSWLSQAEGLASPAAEVFGQIAFAFILLSFMLVKKEDLRNRVLRLVGDGQMTTATKAVDDASRRVSRFLLMQLLINGVFGLVVSVGLYLLGVPVPLLWGFVGFLMRYVPYIGTWLGLIPPVLFTFALAPDDETWKALAVFGLIGGLELLAGSVLEPLLFGTSLGVSEVAQLTSAAFWSFLWGPIGLILSGPLTTCLLVLGKYVPRLKFLDVLLGDEPALAPGVTLFQRLAAKDQDEAARIIRGSEETDAAVVFDTIVVEALILTRDAALRGDLSPDDERYVLAATRELVEDLADDLRKETEVASDGPAVRLLAVPARDEADAVGLQMLAAVMPVGKWETEVSASATLTSELIERVAERAPDVLVIGVTPPGGLSHTRYMCKRLKARFPGLKILVGRWGEKDGPDEARKELAAAGADDVLSSLFDARVTLEALRPVLEAQQPDAALPMAAGQSVASRPAVGTAPA